jgi:hypothetical protein
MPRFSNMKQMQKDSAAAQPQPSAELTKSPRKAPGTRLGMLQDWRGASNKSGKISAGIGKTLRDGR